MPPLEYPSDGDEEEEIELYPIHLWSSSEMEEDRDPDEGPATPPESNSDTGGEPIPQDDDVPYEEIYEHLIERDRTEMKDFIEKYNLQEYEERIFGHPIYRTVDLLISRDIDELMWPSGWSGRRPYFTIEEANEIFGAILRYHSEVYDET